MIASIIGATGYTGGELLRLLLNHNKVEIGTLTSESYAGKKVSDVHPNLTGLVEQSFVSLEMNKIIDESDIIFAALPHGASNEIISKIYSINENVNLIDLSGDFRFDDLAVYEEWYKIKHTDPGLNKKAVFGLPELYKEKIKKAKLIANPGCYPTSAVLGSAPLLKNNLVKTDVIVDSKSGVSGAGKKLT
ncbi:MAG: N-acetyl-gamma-glutamyl-phosphate reductase, partial [Candidatus Methanofastidiosa archaeon]|nr:N-acetyl-gamma-glutamyl-phosphate reductase [Candidatus Methanofastidiosa archaeon]